MTYTYALIDEAGTATMIGDHEDELIDPRLIEISDETPKPQVGWVYDGSAWSKPTTLTNSEVLLTRIPQAISANQAYLALSPPTQAQVVQQVNALTRQINGLLRLVGKQLDDTT